MSSYSASRRGVNFTGSAEVQGFAESEGDAQTSEDTDIAEVAAFGGEGADEDDDGIAFSDSADGSKGPDESDHAWDISGSSS